MVILAGKILPEIAPAWHVFDGGLANGRRLPEDTWFLDGISENEQQYMVPNEQDMSRTCYSCNNRPYENLICGLKLGNNCKVHSKNWKTTQQRNTGVERRTSLTRNIFWCNIFSWCQQALKHVLNNLDLTSRAKWRMFTDPPSPCQLIHSPAGEEGPNYPQSQWFCCHEMSRWMFEIAEYFRDWNKLLNEV